MAFNLLTRIKYKQKTSSLKVKFSKKFHGNESTDFPEWQKYTSKTYLSWFLSGSDFLSKKRMTALSST